MEETAWITVYTGRPPVLEFLEQELQARGFTVARQPYQELGGQFEVGIFATQNASVYNLCVPKEEHDARREELIAAVQEAGGVGAGDEAAIREAEEDYDVRGCSVCGLYFHDNYALCPEHGGTLVPAVDCFAEGQLEPDRVIVGHGEHTAPIYQRLHAAQFTAHITTPDGWSRPVVDLPWSELTGRTAEAEAAIRGVG